MLGEGARFGASLHGVCAQFAMVRGWNIVAGNVKWLAIGSWMEKKR